jgi:hypothetical protein
MKKNDWLISSVSLFSDTCISQAALGAVIAPSTLSTLF